MPDPYGKVALPAGLVPGYHVIEVECTDAFGAVHLGRRIVRIEAGG